MLTQLLATKRHMMQAWNTAGIRLPLTVLRADCTIIGKAANADRLMIGTGTKKLKNMNKPQRSQLMKAGLSFGVRKMRETVVEATDLESVVPGTKVAPSAVVAVGDIVKVTGTSKGHGFTGVVARHGFKGGPRTHGQADRERAPGSIGAGTTPGRVYRQKRMAGRSGNAQVTVEGLQVLKIDDVTGEIWVKGAVPGSINGIVLVTKTGTAKFDGLLEKIAKVEVTPEATVEIVAESEVKA